MSTTGEPEIAGASPNFQDRSRRLVILGILALLVGAGSALLALLVLVLAITARLLPASGLARIAPRLAAAEVLIYFLIAALFVACGIGSIRARRWVRPVMLTTAWTWLLCGLLGTSLMLFLLPDMIGSLPAEAQPLPPAARAIILSVILGISGVLTVILPAIFCWGYQSRDLLLTCEARNPAPAWTDRCPTPVLAWSLGLACGAVFCAPLALLGVLPLFGRLLTGIPAGLLTLVGGAITGYLAWACYRLRSDGWWGSLVLLSLALVSTVTTFRSMDLLEIDRQLGYSEEQLTALRPFTGTTGAGTLVCSVVLTMACAGYLLYIRRHFVARGAKRTGARVSAPP